MKKILVLLAMLFSFNAFAGDGFTLTFMDGTTKTFTMEELKAFNEVSKALEPRILPAITATIGVIMGAAAASTAGFTVPVIMLTATIDGVVYYFYGYGITRFFDEMALDSAYKARIKSAKAQAMHLKEEMEKGAVSLNDRALQLKDRVVTSFN